MPPVGQKRACGKGPPSALSAAMPPAGTAGKSWLAPEAEIRAGNFAAITERARRTLAALQ
jgi:2-dehydro-3-deoxyphosphogluconate aldolase/(4S)-4-hydroxy-2-oxoglutarate aldolase